MYLSMELPINGAIPSDSKRLISINREREREREIKWVEQLIKAQKKLIIMRLVQIHCVPRYTPASRLFVG